MGPRRPPANPAVTPAYGAPGVAPDGEGRAAVESSVIRGTCIRNGASGEGTEPLVSSLSGRGTAAGARSLEAEGVLSGENADPSLPVVSAGDGSGAKLGARGSTERAVGGDAIARLVT